MTNATNTPDLASYDKIIVAFSGGKDSLACLLHLLDEGVSRERIELWHHHIDGAPGSETFMDWPVTEAYCRAVADALNIPLKFSWKVDGFKGEMLRENSLTKPIQFEASDGTVMQVGGTRGKLSTRRVFPQLSASLSTRWCSAYLKIDVCARVFANDPAFKTGRFLLVTGERAEESSARAKYETLEPHRASNKSRTIDQWRPVHAWSELDVWAIIEAHRIEAHPAYKLGWGRVSCRACIFGNADQWASVKEIAPETFDVIAEYELDFGKTIHRTKSVREQAAKGTAYDMNAEQVAISSRHTFDAPVITPAGQQWQLPVGAFKECGGPS